MYMRKVSVSRHEGWYAMRLRCCIFSLITELQSKLSEEILAVSNRAEISKRKTTTLSNLFWVLIYLARQRRRSIQGRGPGRSGGTDGNHCYDRR
jgi:hypothetical protein